MTDWHCDNCDAWPCKCLDHYHVPMRDEAQPNAAFCAKCLVALDAPVGEISEVPRGHH